MGKIKKFSRFVYSVVGLTGLGSLIWALVDWATFTGMSGWSIFAFVIAVVSMVNWGIVAITGKRDKDLFGLLKI